MDFTEEEILQKIESIISNRSYRLYIFFDTKVKVVILQFGNPGLQFLLLDWKSQWTLDFRYRSFVQTSRNPCFDIVSERADISKTNCISEKLLNKPGRL